MKNMWNRIPTLVMLNYFSVTQVHTCFPSCKSIVEITMRASIRDLPSPSSPFGPGVNSLIFHLCYYSLLSTSFSSLSALFHGIEVCKTKAPENIMYWVQIPLEWMQETASSCEINPIENWRLLHFRYIFWNWYVRLHFTLGPKASSLNTWDWQDSTSLC